MKNFETAKNIASFLVDNKGSVLATWKGKMSANEQRKLFGRTIGRGTIVINGTDETVSNLVKVCFGQDYDYRDVTKWDEL